MLAPFLTTITHTSNLQAFLTLSTVSGHHRAGDTHTQAERTGLARVEPRKETAVPASGQHPRHFIALCGRACMREHGLTWKGFLQAEGGWKDLFPRVLNQLCIVYLCFHCNPSPTVSSQHAKSYEFWIFGFRVLNL